MAASLHCKLLLFREAVTRRRKTSRKIPMVEFVSSKVEIILWNTFERLVHHIPRHSLTSWFQIWARIHTFAYNMHILPILCIFGFLSNVWMIDLLYEINPFFTGKLEKFNFRDFKTSSKSKLQLRGNCKCKSYEFWYCQEAYSELFLRRRNKGTVYFYQFWDIAVLR